MKKLIVTADDYGYTKSINEGIVRAATEGLVTDVAIMVLTDHDDLQHGLDLLKQNNLTEVGLHTSLFPWSKSKRPHRGDFIEFFKSATDAEITDKAMGEIKVFEQLIGYKPKFISPQFNMHGNLRLLKVMADYVVQNNIPMRIPRALIENDEINDSNYAAEVFLKRLGVKMTDHLFAHILGSDAQNTMKKFLSELASVKDDQSVEIILHPGYNDVEIFESSTLNFERTRDLSVALNPTFQSEIKALGYTTTHMSNL